MMKMVLDSLQHLINSIIRSRAYLYFVFNYFEGIHLIMILLMDLAINTLKMFQLQKRFLSNKLLLSNNSKQNQESNSKPQLSSNLKLNHKVDLTNLNNLEALMKTLSKLNPNHHKPALQVNYN